MTKSCNGHCGPDMPTLVTEFLNHRATRYDYIKGHKYCSVCEKAVITKLASCECCGVSLRNSAKRPKSVYPYIQMRKRMPSNSVNLSGA